MDKTDDFIKKLIKDASKLQATDIHFVNYHNNCFIKFRVNEQLDPYCIVDIPYFQKLIFYIKYKSNMNLNISKSPQSSAFNVIIDHHLFRIRVSTMPSGAFESLVLRLNHLKFKEPLRNLLLDSDEDVIFKNSVKHRSGLIVITGPTCSGKTTLTYCLLNDLKQMGLSIVTIEDPVEHYEEGFVQLQINENAGINYYSSVKEVLRHDPDVIFIGEIRDELTAKSAIRASLTGHLVISTMHAASCLKAIYRFIELGLTISDLDQTLRLVTNQRLIIHQNFKKIVFEYLDAIMLSDALNCLRKNENYNYQTIENKLNLISDYEVIKE